jgi:hypothetical protein
MMSLFANRLSDLKIPQFEVASTKSFAMKFAIGIAVTGMLITLWALTHRYDGLARDGELYAVQAMARLHPNLNGDLYLRYTSQDQYSIFSSIYSSAIRAVGMGKAELVLFLSFTAWFLAAAWMLVRTLSNREAATLSVALLIITIGYYGAYQIFSYSENYLTARSLAQALVASSLACHYCGRRVVALCIAIGSMFVHPLMTLPGLLLLACQWIPFRMALAAAAPGTVGTLGVALVATKWPATDGLMRVMDANWLEVVRERSQFLFLRYWTRTDWELAIQPFVCLTLSALIVRDPRVGKLSAGAMLVGASGMGIALIACTVGPVAILLQGQAWRWMWVTSFVSVILIVPTALIAWRNPKCGPLCATLLIMGWTYSGVDGLQATCAALALWLFRDRIGAQSAKLLNWTAGIICVVLLASMIGNGWTISGGPIPESGREPLSIARIREFFGMGVSCVFFMCVMWYAMKTVRSAWTAAIIAALFFGLSSLVIPGSLKQMNSVGTRAEIEAFQDWRDKIPADRSILVVPTRKSASFIWFTLGRTSYLSVDQSSGVVFSREVATEVRRRANVLLPVSEPDWMILTQITEQASGKRKDRPKSEPLTATTLGEICKDPELGFVISEGNVGFEPIRHGHSDGWRNWSLYDCSRVQPGIPRA